MKGRTGKQIGSLLSNRINPHGRTLAKLSTREVAERHHTTPRDQPRASSPINDNHCVDKLQGGLLAGSQTATQEHLINSSVNLNVVNPVHTAPGHSQKKGVSPGLPVCHMPTDYKLKYVKGVSCNQCQTCCTKSSCRGQTSKLLANLAAPRCRSEGSLNPERGLHPPLSDPAKTSKVSHSHKPLCQSSQEQLPVGGITSAYRQKCSRASKKQNLSGLFQPAIFSPQTKPKMETYTRSEQPEFFPQGGEIQDGDTGNHQDIPPTRGVGYLNRLQGRLLPYSNTGTIQEISQISCPGSDIPIQSSAFRSVHSTLGVHCSSKGGETDGHTQGYKNPPVPRRLVGESQIPPNLSPTYPNASQDMPGSRLAGEFGKIRAGAQTSLQLCRLPVRPQVRPGQTDTGPVAKSSRKDTSTFYYRPVRSGSSCP